MARYDLVVLLVLAVVVILILYTLIYNVKDKKKPGSKGLQQKDLTANKRRGVSNSLFSIRYNIKESNRSQDTGVSSPRSENSATEPLRSGSVDEAPVTSSELTPELKSPLPHHLPVGTLVGGRYKLDGVLGEGGFGITYLAHDTKLGLSFAVKEYFPRGLSFRNTAGTNEVYVGSDDVETIFSHGKERFLDEARALVKFNDEPAVVSVVDFVEQNNTVYLVMEYLNGVTLQQYLKRHGRMTAEEAFVMLDPVMRALEKIHAAGVIHRDISPDNIMRLKDGRLKLMDFGAAKEFVDENRSMSVMLKKGYAPEEQYRRNGKQGPWTDVYALCATLYRCITGVTPMDSLDRLVEDTLQPPSELGCEISPKLEDALMYGLAVLQQDRCKSMTELIGMVTQAIDTSTGSKFNTGAYRTMYAEADDRTVIAEEPYHEEGETVVAEAPTADHDETVIADETDHRQSAAQDNTKPLDQTADIDIEEERDNLLAEVKRRLTVRRGALIVAFGVLTFVTILFHFTPILGFGTITKMVEYFASLNYLNASLSPGIYLVFFGLICHFIYLRTAKKYRAIYQRYKAAGREYYPVHQANTLMDYRYRSIEDIHRRLNDIEARLGGHPDPNDWEDNLRQLSEIKGKRCRTTAVVALVLIAFEIYETIIYGVCIHGSFVGFLGSETGFAIAVLMLSIAAVVMLFFLIKNSLNDLNGYRTISGMITSTPAPFKKEIFDRYESMTPDAVIAEIKEMKKSINE